MLGLLCKAEMQTLTITINLKFALFGCSLVLRTHDYAYNLYIYVCHTCLQSLFVLLLVMSIVALEMLENPSQKRNPLRGIEFLELHQSRLFLLM